MTSRTIYLTLALLFNAGVAQAQPDSSWAHTFDGGEDEQCFAHIQTADGGFALAGLTFSFGAGGSDFWLVRTDESGDSLLSCTFGGEGDDYPESLLQLDDGGFVLAGRTASFGAGSMDFWLVRSNGEGDSLWSRTFGGRDGDACTSIIQTADGGFVLAGLTESFGAGSYDFWLIKTNPDGDSLWSRTFGGRENDVCRSIIQTADGGFVLAGLSESFGAGSYDIWLIKTNPDGDSLWSHTFGGRDDDRCYSLIQMADGGFALAGRTASFGVGTDFWLVRTNENGDSLWSRSFGGENYETCASAIQTSDGGLAMAGITSSFGVGNADFWLMRTDASGDSLWSCTFIGGMQDYCNSLSRASDGGFVLAGYTNSFGAGSSDFYLVKTTPDPVSVRSSDPVHPSSLILHPSFPNPFNSMVTIPFGLDKSAPTRLAIFDPLGRRLADLIPSQVMSAGSHSAVWSANAFPAGSYLVRLESGAESLTQPIRLVK